jgi:AraC family transcriptional regulator, regulatory protein of adaptative response / methylated-DNA-[protein]-cysteine methyltransferase
MNQHKHFTLIANAIEYLHANFKNQPSLDKIAEHVHLSPFHFQRIFTEWAGISPKKFLQYLSVTYAKELLSSTTVSVLDAAHNTGLSGTGRLHDLFITIEGMTPGEYKQGGRDLNIGFHFLQTPFGEAIVGSTEKGICHIAFCDNKQNALQELKAQFPHANYQNEPDSNQKNRFDFFGDFNTTPNNINLHVKGTQFQLKVWEALLKIPTGQLTTYGDISQHIGKPKAARAVGTAIGSNPIAFLIPCHRVIQSTGTLGGYRWNPTRKAAMIGWEIAHHPRNTLEE